MADEETKPTASITNIYYDCLERIFDFLDLESLLNVANTCKRLQIAAAAKFSDEYGTKRIIIVAEDYPIVGNAFFVEDDFIFIYGRKFQLPFLRCFGSKILRLELTGPAHESVERYINQYCGDALTSLTCSGGLVFPPGKPFKNLETLKTGHGVLGVEFSNFTNWYPNLRHLELLYADIRTDNISVNLPHLEHLGMWLSQQTTERIADLLNANLQLQSLNITTIDFDATTMSLATVLNMIRTHQSILKLKVSLNIVTRVFAAELSQLANEHPSITELNLKEHLFTVDDAVALIYQLKSLKKFGFCVQDEAEYNRIRDQLNDDWQCKYCYLEWFEPLVGYAIELNRKN